MQIDKRPTVVFILFCLSAFIIASCAGKDIKTGKDRTPDAESVESHRVGSPAEASETSTKGGSAVVTETDIVPPLAVPREDRIDQKILSEMRTFESTPIYFDFDQSTLTPDARTILGELAGWLQANPKYSLQIEGHGDERGSDGYNLALGEGRAIAAKKYLQMLGIEMDRISTLSYGEEKPADPGHTEEAWAKNRRDEFRLIRKP